MPCVDYEAEREELKNKNLQNKYQIQKSRIDNVTRLLCGVMYEVESTDISTELIKNVSGLSEWWTEHKRMDALREENERKMKEQKRLEKEQKRIKEAALNKLSEEEKRALGL
jgi:hypothetical protein